MNPYLFHMEVMVLAVGEQLPLIAICPQRRAGTLALFTTEKKIHNSRV